MHVARLFDEAGEPIRYYSLFERDEHSDPRYDNGSNNSEETTDNAANNESNSQPATKKCQWCHASLSGDSYDYQKYSNGECSSREWEDCLSCGKYCSQKCAIEACSAEN